MPRSIPSDFAPLWEDLSSEVTWLVGRWQLYRELFLKSDVRVELLNAVDPAFFSVLQSILADDAILGIARLMDPPGNPKQQNSVLARLRLAPAIASDPALQGEVQARLQSLDSLAEPIRLVRHKRLAHRDLNVALSQPGAGLPAVTISMIEEVVEKVTSLMNTIQVHFTGMETGYSRGIWGLDAGGMIASLRAGLAYEDASSNGLIPWDHIDKSPFRDA